MEGPRAWILDTTEKDINFINFVVIFVFGVESLIPLSEISILERNVFQNFCSLFHEA